jgi:hypothetical protein
MKPSWVEIAGYGLEKIHTGVLAHALDQKSDASNALLAALWHRATGVELDPKTITNVVVAPEERVAEGAVIDLLVGFNVGGLRHRLGFELKVDSAPRASQVKRELDGVAKRAEKDGEKAFVVLLSLGAAQVCHAGEMPVNSARWQLEQLLEVSDLIRAALGADHIFEPWLAKLVEEKRIRAAALDLPAGTAHRGRCLHAYRLAALVEPLQIHGISPWHVRILQHNVVAHAVGSYVPLPLEGCTATLYVEVTDQALAIKAWSDPPVNRLGMRLESVVTELRRRFAPECHLSSPQMRDGASATLLQARLDLTDVEGARRTVRTVAEAWPVAG